MLTFDRKQNINEIYKINNILGLRVKIEPLRRKSTLIPQCKRCQMYGHTQKYCNRQEKCVKCAGKHLTRNCNMSRNEVPKCVNCGGDHPASYRGCSVATKLQKIRDDALGKQKRNVSMPPAYKTNVQVHSDANNVKLKKTVSKQLTLDKMYSQALKETESEQKDEKSAKPITTDGFLQKILAELEEQKKTNKMILTRINLLEGSVRKAPKKKKL